MNEPKELTPPPGDGLHAVRLPDDSVVQGDSDIELAEGDIAIFRGPIFVDAVRSEYLPAICAALRSDSPESGYQGDRLATIADLGEEVQRVSRMARHYAERFMGIDQRLAHLEAYMGTLVDDFESELDRENAEAAAKAWTRPASTGGERDEPRYPGESDEDAAFRAGVEYGRKEGDERDDSE